MRDMMTDVLESRDIRALLRLVGEIRELGGDPAAWRAHLATQLDRLLGAAVVVVSEVRVNGPTRRSDAYSGTCSELVTRLHAMDAGLDGSSREGFYRDAYFIDHSRDDDALRRMVPLYGTAFTVLRSDLVEDAAWSRSHQANCTYRRFGCDDFIASMMPVSSLGVICAMQLFRPPGRRFTQRERLFVELLHEELLADWSRASRGDRGARLTPRQRQVLARLAEGVSEKQIAYDLGVSAHTAHDHVKAIYRAFGASSRGELLARLTSGQPGSRARLVAESA